MIPVLAVFVAWTNTANQVVWATPVELRGSRVVMVCRDGGEREYPLSIFPPREQRRIKGALGVYELPAALAELRSVFAAELKRAIERHDGGAMSDEDFAAKRDKVHAAWQKALGDAKLSPDEIVYWKGRLK
ncbi:MAG: hypothetical protein ACI4QT_01920 [Kiritimatiellia bacterium]